MERRINISRDTETAIRSYLSRSISDSLKELRGADADFIVNLLNNIDIDRTQIAEINFDNKILTDEMINNLLDSIYLDHSILYHDIFDLQDNLTRLRYLFDSTILSLSRRSGEIASELSDLNKLQNSRFGFTDVLHNSFTTDYT